MIAYQCPDTLVTIVDVDQRRIDAWNSDSLPMYEPGLEDILASIRQRPTQIAQSESGEDMSNLRFSTDIEQAINDADIIVLCIDTPTKSFGIGKGVAPDLSNIQAAVRTIARVATSDKIVVEKSTVPCGTAELIRDLVSFTCVQLKRDKANENQLQSGSPHQVRFEVLSNPEFLSEGTTITDLLHPSRVLIGCQQTPSGTKAAAALSAIYEAWVPRDRIKTMDCWSSELSKLAANAMLAQRLSSINSLSAICEAVGGDVDSLSMACGLDPRLGPAMLKSGLGWGGGCFEKDVLDLVYIARTLGLDAVADYWASVIEMNNEQKTRFLRRILSCMHGSVRGKSIAILGFAFKKNTSDTKKSPAIPVVRGLLAEGARISIYDPMVPSTTILADLAPLSDRERAQLHIRETAYEACDNADAVAIVTEWDEFRMAETRKRSSTQSTLTDDEQDWTTQQPPTSRCLTPDSEENLFTASPVTRESVDWEHIVHRMQNPKFVFDGRNILPGERMEALGCRYVRVGRMSEWDAVRMSRYPFSG